MSARPSFLDALDERVLVCDGAMGTMLYGRGVFLNRCFDELNVTQPDLVAEVHQAYVRAGADVIETNTFGANRFKLANFGLAGDVRAINVQGARVARHAARDTTWVAGSIGPLGVRIEPWGRTGIDEAEVAFREQAQALVEGGVDLFILETFRDLNEIAAAIRALRAVADLPIVAQMTTEEDGNTLDGTPPEAFAPALERAGAAVVGVNCSVGPAAMLETLEAMARFTSAKLVAQPNAGRPRDVDGRNLYLCSPEYMASYARRFIAAGARLVGGCCGTTPDHIRQIALAARTVAPRSRPARLTTVDGPTEPAPLAARAEPSRLARAFADRRFAVIAEVSSPRGLDLGPTLVQASRFHDLGAVAVNVPDYPRSGARASAMALAVLIQQQGQVEVLLHFACRGRTLVAMQSDLVGLHAMGVRNVLLTTGQPVTRGDYPDATAGVDVDAIGLTNLVVRLNQGLDLAGQPIGAPTHFHIGVAVNPFAPDLDAEWRRLDHKIEAGAEFLVTPPIFDVDAFEAVLPRLRATGRPVVAGLAALEGIRHAEFFASEVAGVRLPDQVLHRLRQAIDDRADALAFTVETAARLREAADGIQLTAVHGSPRTTEQVLSRLRSPQRLGSEQERRHG
jgi:homocysteine S-methyltransferase